jgi:hypothetical protein
VGTGVEAEDSVVLEVDADGADGVSGAVGPGTAGAGRGDCVREFDAWVEGTLGGPPKRRMAARAAASRGVIGRLTGVAVFEGLGGELLAPVAAGDSTGAVSSSLVDAVLDKGDDRVGVAVPLGLGRGTDRRAGSGASSVGTEMDGIDPGAVVVVGLGVTGGCSAPPGHGCQSPSSR